jgi:hypothetical protein
MMQLMSNVNTCACQPMTLVMFGKINSSVVAKRMSPAWRTFECLNMADPPFLLFPEASLHNSMTAGVALPV